MSMSMFCFPSNCSNNKTKPYTHTQIVQTTSHTSCMYSNHDTIYLISNPSSGDAHSRVEPVLFHSKHQLLEQLHLLLCVLDHIDRCHANGLHTLTYHCYSNRTRVFAISQLLCRCF